LTCVSIVSVSLLTTALVSRVSLSSMLAVVVPVQVSVA